MNWSDYFMQIAQTVSLKSKDDVKVGTVLVRDNDILTLGFNGLPRGVKEHDFRYKHPQKQMFMEHAEANAVNNAARLGISLQGATAYVTWFPCADCARRLIQAGVKEIVFGRYPDTDHHRWGVSFQVAMEMFQEAGVHLHHHLPDKR